MHITQQLRKTNPTKQHHRQRPKNNPNGLKSIKTRHQNSNGENRMKVTIDSREQSRIESAKQYYTKQGLDVEVAELPIGDYIFTNNNDSVVFEFKLISDFVSSIQDGRVFNQAISQAETFNHHYVIIHGDEHTRAKSLAMSRNYRKVTVYQYIGAISSLNRYTTVIESYSPYLDEAYYRMLSTANKALSNKPIVKRHGKKSKNTAFNILTNDIYGVNWKKAQAIVKTYNLKTIADLLQLTHEDLTKIDGIADKTATNIITQIGEL